MGAPAGEDVGLEFFLSYVIQASVELVVDLLCAMKEGKKFELPIVRAWSELDKVELLRFLSPTTLLCVSFLWVAAYRDTSFGCPGEWNMTLVDPVAALNRMDVNLCSVCPAEGMTGHMEAICF